MTSLLTLHRQTRCSIPGNSPVDTSAVDHRCVGVSDESPSSPTRNGCFESCGTYQEYWSEQTGVLANSGTRTRLQGTGAGSTFDEGRDGSNVQRPTSKPRLTPQDRGSVQ